MLSVIGDVHGKSNDYLALARKLEGAGHKTIQLGDMGFNYAHMGNLDLSKHRFFKGNHDNPNAASSYDLGRYGYFDDWEDCPPFFFLSGGFSIDKKFRTEDIDWWSKEELDIKEMCFAYEDYKKIRPDLLICHEPPYSFGQKIGNPEILKSFGFDPETFASSTSRLLDEMIKVHQPKLVVCGHFHLDRFEQISGVNYLCLDELSYVLIDKELYIK